MSKGILIILIACLVLAAIILAYTRDLLKDRMELRKTRIEDKFRIILGEIDFSLLNGKGTILPHSQPRTVNMCDDHVMISLWYGTGHLTITMVYEFEGREIIFDRTYGNVRDITDDDQRNIARNYFIPYAREQVEQHRMNVSLSRI